MEEIKQLSDDVIEQIKDFDHDDYWNGTGDQKLLIDKLILDEELNRNYRSYGLCKECKQPKTSNNWCQICNANHFQRNFKNWSSGNDDVDKFIQKLQLKAKDPDSILEWIEHDRFENIEYIAKGGFGTVYKAIWKDGPIYEQDSENNQWKRGLESYDPESKDWKRVSEKTPVALKCLHNSQDITAEFKRSKIFFYNF